jgi:hypothetical protein
MLKYQSGSYIAKINNFCNNIAVLIKAAFAIGENVLCRAQIYANSRAVAWYE